MATIYICKCGRQVRKSTNADTTGNRDTENCKGCPYLLPWGPFEYVPGQGFVRNVRGYECRMSKDIEYATRFCGSIDDKCSCYIASLDFDFLTRVSNWIKETYPGGELNGSFFTDDIRAYVSNGRYRMSISCAQNKKGIAAKAALLHQFFDASGARLDMTPEEEKAHILAAIEAGKAKARERKENMDYIISENLENDCVYAYTANEFWVYDKQACRWYTSGFCREQYEQAKLQCPSLTPEDFLEDDNDYNLLDDYELPRAALDALLEAVKGGKREAAPFENTNPTPAAPASPVDAAATSDEETRTTPAAASGAALESLHAQSALPQNAPAQDIAADAPSAQAFDYSGLDAVAVDTLHVAERIIRTARQKYIVDMAGAVSMVHGELVRNSDEHNNQHTEDTFIAWCRFMGISKTTAYQLLQVQSLISGATAEEQATLEAASPSLLYAAAKPSAPAELVQAVKDGDITTHKQYQEALAEIKARDAKIQELLEMSENSDRRADEAEDKAKKAEQERDAARDAQAASSRLANMITNQRDEAQIRAERAELRAKAAEEDAAEKDKRIRELETIRPQTIEATVVERIRMPEMAEEDAAELTTNLAASVTTVQRTFFMAAAAMAPQVKARCANTLWDTVNELATLLAASANPSYEEEEATPFD